MEIWNVEDGYKSRKDKTEILDGYKAYVSENGLDETGGALVMLAAKYAHIEALRWLADEGTSLNVTDKYGFTPLHELAKKETRYYRPGPDDMRECARFLLGQGVSVLRKDENEYMVCYHYAARSGNYGFVEELQGKKLDMTDKHGNSGIHIACDNVRHAMSTLHYASDLVEKTRKYFDETVARLASRNYDAETLRQYMENNHIKTVEQAEQEYAELEAVVEAYYKTVKAFADGGLDLDEKNDYGESGLDIAVKYGAKKIAAYLSGEDVEDSEAVSAGGMTIHQAVETGDIEAIRTIAGRGGDLDAVNGNDGRYAGFTPLSIACAFLNCDAISALIAGGADVNVKDNEGHTALYFLAREGYAEKKDNINRIKEIMTLFKKAGYDINGFVNDDSDTLLNYNCKYGFKELIDLLLQSGADVNIANRFGETPLMRICKKDSSEMENLQVIMLENGADVTAKDQNGHTALHYAAKNGSHSAAKNMAEMLFEFGKVDVGAVSNEGKTALDIAAEADNEPLVKWLLAKM